MLEKYLELKNKFIELEQELQNPAIVNDTQKLKTVSQDYNDLKPTAEKITQLEQVETELTQTEELLKTLRTSHFYYLLSLNEISAIC